MKTRKFSYPPIHVGVSLLLVVFLVLCMVIFSVLSLSGALKDYKYSEKNAIRTTEYYEANNLAEEKLAEIGRSMSADAAGTIEFTVPINESKLLLVILEVHPGETPGYQILTWKQISTADWTGDQTLPVLGTK